MRLRQLVIAAGSLKTADQLRGVLGLGEPYADPGVAEFGLVNAVFAIGDQFLEVVVPVNKAAPAARFIARGGEGGYMAIFQTGDLAAARGRAKAAGIRRVWDVDLKDISASHLHPADIGGAIVSIDEARPKESWRWGGPIWEAQAVPGKLTGAVIEGVDAETLAARWSIALGQSVDGNKIALEDATLSFKLGKADRLASFEITLPDPAAALARAADMGLPVQGQTVRLGGVDLIIN